MNERSMRALEWVKITAELQEYATFSLGKNLVEGLYPSTNYEKIKRDIELTSAGLSVLWKKGTPPFGGATDISHIIKRARRDGILEGEQLLQVADLIHCSRQMKKYLIETKEIFVHFCDNLQEIPHLAKEINRCIDDDGNIKDSASTGLLAIRQKMRSLANRVRDKLDGIIHSSQNQKILQEPIVTIRGDRYVVPVKQEYKGQFPGIVHEQSASGATLFMEPTVVVELNNQLRLAEQEENREILRILRNLSESARDVSDELERSLLTLAELDFIFAKAKYSRDMQAIEPVINQDGRVHIKKGRHPLLKGEVVPTTIWLGDTFHILVITGPNTGGKTVTLKTMGLFSLMTQAGLHIPALEGSEISIFNGVFADIGDEQSIEQSLSTFSSHMSNIVDILSRATNKSLVLLDELGAGTDPTEGAALARAILEHLKDKKITTVATTHYSNLKNFAFQFKDVENASVEFDMKTLQPTYHLSIGIPGKSNAFAIANRLGLSDDLVEKARNLLSEEQVHVDDIIEEIETNRKTTRLERQKAEELVHEYNKLKHQYEQLVSEYESKKEQIIDEARREAEDIVNKTKREMDQLIGDLRKQHGENLESEIQHKRLELADHKKELTVDNHVQNNESGPKNLKVGERVRIKSLNQIGYVVQEQTSSKEVMVQAGIMKVSVSTSDLERVQAGKDEVFKMTRSKNVKNRKSQAIRPQVDVRGQTKNEAITLIDKYLDDAFLAGLPQVRIIHGKGTGVLRKAVKDQLKNHPHVKSFRLGEISEGGDGVTSVELKPIN